MNKYLMLQKEIEQLIVKTEEELKQNKNSINKVRDNIQQKELELAIERKKIR